MKNILLLMIAFITAISGGVTLIGYAHFKAFMAKPANTIVLSEVIITAGEDDR